MSLGSRCRTGSLRDHPGLARVIEQPARIHHRAHVAQRLEPIDLARVLNRHRARVQVHRHHVARLQHFAQPVHRFTGIQLARGDGVAEEDARETLRQHDLAARRAERNRRVLAGAAAAEIAPGDHDRILAVELALLDIARAIKPIPAGRRRRKRPASRIPRESSARDSNTAPG